MAVKVPRHDPLPQQFHAMHLLPSHGLCANHERVGFGAASAVVSNPSSPKRAAHVFRCSQDFVACHGTGNDGRPRPDVLAGRDDRLGTSICDGSVALACVIGAVCSDTADLLIDRDLIEQIRQHSRITDEAPGNLESADFQCFLVDPKVDFAPDSPLLTPMRVLLHRSA